MEMSQPNWSSNRGSDLPSETRAKSAHPSKAALKNGWILRYRANAGKGALHWNDEWGFSFFVLPLANAMMCVFILCGIDNCFIVFTDSRQSGKASCFTCFQACTCLEYQCGDTGLSFDVIVFEDASCAREGDDE